MTYKPFVYVIAEFLGIDPHTAVAVIGVGSVLLFMGLLTTLMTWAQNRENRRYKNRNLLGYCRTNYSRYKSVEKPVMELIRPVLLKFQEVLSRRDGRTYEDIEWSLGREHLTIYGSFKGELPAELEPSRHRKLLFPLYYFDEPHDPVAMVKAMVWEHEDEEDVK